MWLSAAPAAHRPTSLAPPAQISDLLFIVAACVIVGNIVSILVFKVRLY